MRLLRRTAADRRAPAVPQSLRWAQVAVLVVAAVHIAALVLVLTHQDALRATVASDHPNLAPGQIDAQARQLVLQSALPHIVLPLLLAWRARALISGRRRAQVVLTVLLGVQLAAHATLPLVLHRLPGYTPAVIGVQAFSFIFEITALILLWHPASRAFIRTSRTGNGQRVSANGRVQPTRWTRPMQQACAAYAVLATVLTALVPAFGVNLPQQQATAGHVYGALFTLLVPGLPYLVAGFFALKRHSWAFWLALVLFGITACGVLVVPLRTIEHYHQLTTAGLTLTLVNDALAVPLVLWMFAGIIRYRKPWASRPSIGYAEASQ